MKLYGAPYPAPNPRRVRIFLAEKGIDLLREAFTTLRTKLPNAELKIMGTQDLMEGASAASPRNADVLMCNPTGTSVHLVRGLQTPRDGSKSRGRGFWPIAACSTHQRCC